MELLDPLERAAGNGDAQATATQLASNASFPIDGNSAASRPLRRTVLHWASFGGNPNVVKAVLQTIASNGASAADGEGHAVDAAAAEVAVSGALAATCLSKVGGPDGTTALHLAVEGGHFATVLALVEAGSNVSVRDGHNRTPLSLAVGGGREEIVLALLRQGGAHVDTAMPGGGTVLHLATLRGNVAISAMLLSAGARVNVEEPLHFFTPLHLAAGCGPNAGRIINALVAAGAHVNPIAEMRGTPLCLAVMGGPRSRPVDGGVYDPAPAIRALVAAGADPHMGDENEASAVERAVWTDNAECLSLFLELGVDPNHRRPFNPPLSDLPSDATLWEAQSFMHGREKYGGASLLHYAAGMLSDGAVELLLAAGAREDIPAFEDAKREDAPEVATVPADVIGYGIEEEMTPELQKKANAIRAMLAGAHLYRKGWLSVLRARFDAGESLTGPDGGGKDHVGGDRSDGTEGPSSRRQKGEAAVSAAGACVIAPGGSVGRVDGTAADDGAWCRAAVWIASVPGPDVFQNIAGFL